MVDTNNNVLSMSLILLCLTEFLADTKFQFNVFNFNTKSSRG